MKKITLISLATFLVLLFSTTVGYGQTVTLPQESACSYTGCNAGDLTITKAYIALDNNVPLGTCIVGSTVNAFLYIQVSTGPKYNIYVQFDLYNGNTKINGSDKYTYAEPVTGTLIPNTPIKIAPITFTCGDALELKNIYVSWKTGGASSNPASCAGVGGAGSKCADASSIPNIPVNTPIAANFDFSPTCIDAGAFEKVVFTNTSTGGDGTLTYLWDFGTDATPATSTASGKSPNPITVTYSTGGSKTISIKVTDADGDTQTKPSTITVASCCTVAINSIVKTNVQCNGNSDGTVTATSSGGQGTISYDLLYSATSGGSFTDASATDGDSDGSYTGLGVGFYKVVVNEANGCSNTSSAVEITEPSVVNATETLASHVDVNCFGSSTGSFTVVATGGAGTTYTYSLSSDFSNSNTTGVFSGLSAGTYTVYVKDTNNCTDPSPVQVTITQPTAALSASATGESLYCEGDADGNITLTVLGGTPTYTYSWKKTGDNVTVVSTAQNPSGLSAGTYNVTVTDANGCTTTASATIVDGDGADPVVTAPAAYTLEGCDTNAIVGRIYSETEVAIASPYSGLVIVETGTGIASVTYKDTKSGTCPIVVIRTFTVKDNCGNEGTATQEIRIIDTTAPVLTIPANASIECTADISPSALGTATATDNCDGSLTPTFVDGDCFGLENKKEVNAGTGIYQYFNISGMAGLNVNSIKAFNLTFETNQGKGRAEFILVAPNGRGIVLVGPYCAGGDCDDNDGGTEIYSPTFYPSTSGYNAWINSNFIAEGAGNFTPNGGTTTNTVTGLTNGLVSTFEALTAGMTSLDGNWFIYSKKQENVNGNVRFISSCLTPGLSASCANNDVIIREWTVTDACGNTSTGNQVIVISDTTAPVVTGSITASNLEGCTVEDAPDAVTTVAALEALTGNLSISDNCSDKANLKVSSSDSVSGTCPIVITRTYKVTDECSNTSVDIIHTININDLTDPTGTAPADITNLKDIANIPAADIEAILNESDNCSSVSVTVNDTNNGGSGCSGDAYIVTRTYTLTDACGNDIDLVQTITVEADAVIVDDPTDVTECESYTLPALTNGAYFGTTGGVNPIAVGTVITETTTIYVYAVSEDNANCTAENSFLVTINALPAAPVSGGDQSECEASEIQTLTATATVPTGFSIVWYDAATEGNVVANPTLNAVGSVTYYAESVNDATDCTSTSRTAVSLEILAAPAAPIAGNDQSECEASETQTLTASATVPTGFSVVWYDAATGGEIVVNPILNAVGSVTYYAESVNDATNCTSISRTAVSLEILAAPVAPISGGNQIECEASPIQTLTATANVSEGFSIVWYNAVTGGEIVVNPILNAVGSVTYYAESSNGNCSSLTRTAVTLTINATPVAPISGGNQTVCSDGTTTQTLTATATGGTITWYTAATGGSVVASPTQVGVGSVTYYAQSSNGTCSSLTRTAVTLTINPAPVAPISGGNQTVCSDGTTTQTLTATATGGIITWHTSATGGSVVTSPTQVGVGSVTYYAQSSNGTCSSLTRTAVTLTINATPAAPISGGNQTVCSDGTTTQTLTATAAGGTITWYTSATGGSVVTSPTQVGVGNVTYYAESSNGTCSSLTRTAVTLTINAKPEVTISGNSVLTCENNSITLTATVTVQGTASYLWSNGAITASIDVTTPGSYSVTVTDSDNGCSVTSDSVTVTQNIAAPSVSVSATNTELNCNTESITITAIPTVQGTASYLWSNGATTASISVTTPGNYSVTVTDSNNGCSITSEGVTITQDIAAPSVSVSAATTVLTCTSESITITASPTVQGTASYLWSNGAITASISVTTPGTYSVTVTDSNNGCSITSEGVTITQDIAAPIVIVSTVTTVLNCTTESIVLTAVVEGTASYLWSNGATTASISVTTPGNYSVTVTGANGCSSTASVTVTGDASQPSVVISGNSVLTCASTSATLVATATVQGTASYLWNTGATTATISVTAPGEYSVTITDSSNGCSVTESVTVAQNITAPAVTISGPTELTCNLTSITLNASGSTVQGTASYLWNTGATTASIAVSQAGVYTVVVTGSGNGCSGTMSVTVTENYVAAQITGGSIALCIEDASLNLTTLLPTGFVTGGTWVDKMSSGGFTGSSFDPSVVNLGDYQFTYTEPGDCGRIITVSVNVNDDCVVLACSTEDMLISKVVTPNDDGYNDSFEITGLDGCGFTYGVKIFNRWGKMVYHSDNYLNNWKGRHDGSGMQIGSNTELPTGTYYYIVTVSGGSGFKPMTGYIYLGTH
ncbi:MAG: gliding motility-associated C-terminal domain-containing protein [Lutibacter sp.]|nr:gliding motility-associated C-terminal domain-containing protein [Lutibacter sp.]